MELTMKSVSVLSLKDIAALKVALLLSNTQEVKQKTELFLNMDAREIVLTHSDLQDFIEQMVLKLFIPRTLEKRLAVVTHRISQFMNELNEIRYEVTLKYNQWKTVALTIAYAPGLERFLENNEEPVFWRLVWPDLEIYNSDRIRIWKRLPSHIKTSFCHVDLTLTRLTVRYPSNQSTRTNTVLERVKSMLPRILSTLDWNAGIRAVQQNGIWPCVSNVANSILMKSKQIVVDTAKRAWTCLKNVVLAKFVIFIVSLSIAIEIVSRRVLEDMMFLAKREWTYLKIAVTTKLFYFAVCVSNIILNLLQWPRKLVIDPAKRALSYRKIVAPSKTVDFFAFLSNLFKRTLTYLRNAVLANLFYLAAYLPIVLLNLLEWLHQLLLDTAMKELSYLKSALYAKLSNFLSCLPIMVQTLLDWPQQLLLNPAKKELTYLKKAFCAKFIYFPFYVDNVMQNLLEWPRQILLNPVKRELIDLRHAICAKFFDFPTYVSSVVQSVLVWSQQLFLEPAKRELNYLKSTAFAKFTNLTAFRNQIQW